VVGIRQRVKLSSILWKQKEDGSNHCKIERYKGADEMSLLNSIMIKAESLDRQRLILSGIIERYWNALERGESVTIFW